jgi:hypothetical protein
MIMMVMMMMTTVTGVTTVKMLTTTHMSLGELKESVFFTCTFVSSLSLESHM